MILIKRDEMGIVAIDKITQLYLGANGASIKAELVNSSATNIATYNSLQDAKIALLIIGEQIAKGTEIIKCPTDKQIQSKIVQTHDTKPQHINGKKIKSHGGS